MPVPRIVLHVYQAICLEKLARCTKSLVGCAYVSKYEKRYEPLVLNQSNPRVPFDIPTLGVSCELSYPVHFLTLQRVCLRLFSNIVCEFELRDSIIT